MSGLVNRMRPFFFDCGGLDVNYVDYFGVGGGVEIALEKTLSPRMHYQGAESRTYL